ncbi:MAG: hypothetical protein PHW47_06525 [Lachnospira sp.]|nr:hypothetical protein [Lachnospira sp.]
MTGVKYFFQHPYGIVSRADILIDVYKSWHSNYVSVAMIMFISLYFNKTDFKYYNIIAYGSKLKVWFIQIKRIYLYSLCSAVYFWLVVLVLSNKYILISINWNKTDSHFFKITGSLMEMKYVYVALAILAVLIFLNIVMATLYILLSWIFTNQIFVWIMEFMIVFFFNKIIKWSPLSQIYYKNWIEGKIIISFLIVVMLLVLLQLVGRFIVRHKEFY